MKIIISFILILGVTATCYAQSNPYNQLKQQTEQPLKMYQEDKSDQSTQSTKKGIGDTSVVQLSDLQTLQSQEDYILVEMQSVSQEIDLINAGLKDLQERLRSLQEQLRMAQQQESGYTIIKQLEFEIAVLNSRIEILQNTLSEKINKMAKLQRKFDELHTQGEMEDSQKQAVKYGFPLGAVESETGTVPSPQEGALKASGLSSD